MAKRLRSRFSLVSALALMASLGAGTAPAQMAAPTTSPLKQAALLDDRAARALTRKVRQHPAMGFTPRRDKGWLNGRGDWIGAKTMEKKRLEAAFGPLSGRQLNRLRKAKRRLANPAADVRTRQWALRMVHNAARLALTKLRAGRAA